MHSLCYAFVFQFQIGAIKRDARFPAECCNHISFNSKLVRLKVGFASMPCLWVRTRFNSKLVRLKARASL